MDITAALMRPLMHGTGRDVSCRRAPVPQLIRRFSPVPRENHTDCMACAQRIGLPGVSVLEPPLVVLYWVTEHQWPVAGARCSNHGVHRHVWIGPPGAGDQGNKCYDEDVQQGALQGPSCNDIGVGAAKMEVVLMHCMIIRCHTRKSPN